MVRPSRVVDVGRPNARRRTGRRRHRRQQQRASLPRRWRESDRIARERVGVSRRFDASPRDILGNRVRVVLVRIDIDASRSRVRRLALARVRHVFQPHDERVVVATIVVATIRRRPRGGCGVVDPREVFPRAYERLSIRRQSRLPPRARHRLEFFRSDGLRDHRRVLRDSIFVFSSRAASLERLFERLGEEWRIPRECVRRGDDRFARHGRAVHLAELAEEREELVGVPLDGGDRVIVERESLESGRGGDVKRGPQGRRARHVAHAIEGDVEDGEMRGAAEISDPPHAVLARVEIREARKPKIRNLLETITVQAQLAERRVRPPARRTSARSQSVAPSSETFRQTHDPVIRRHEDAQERAPLEALEVHHPRVRHV